MSIYATDTSTSVEKTRAELETTLQRFGADAFGYMTNGNKAMIAFQIKNKRVRFILPLPDRSEKRFTERLKYRQRVSTTPEQARLAWEQACCSNWRALFLAVKAKLVAVDAGIAQFENEFMAHLVLPNRRTVSEELSPLIEQSISSGKMPNFQLALPAPGETK